MKTIQDTITDAEKKIERLLSSDLDLETQREIINDNSYTDAFPTSPEAIGAMQWAKALKRFDETHPEIIKKIEQKKSEKIAARKAHYDTPEGREEMWRL